MSYMITDDCISCGACEPECPHQAISEGDTKFEINPDRCTECVGSYTASQCASVCPVDAPVPNPERRETKEELVKKWRRLHPNEEPVTGTY